MPKKRREEEDFVVSDESEESVYSSEEEEEKTSKKTKKTKKTKEVKPTTTKKPKTKTTPTKLDLNAEFKANAVTSDLADFVKKDKIGHGDTTHHDFIAHQDCVLYYVSPNQVSTSKLAMFDFDGCLVRTKSGAEYGVSSDDWVPFSDRVEGKLKELHDEGYRLVVISNQGSIQSALGGKAAFKITGRFRHAMDALTGHGAIPYAIMFSTDNEKKASTREQDANFRKPSPAVLELFVRTLNDHHHPNQDSFYCGDAAGRTKDFAASDKEFAQNIGVKFYVPEDLFGKPSGGNVQLILGMREYAKLCFSAAKVLDDKLKFKGTSLGKAADQIALFPDTVSLTLPNWKKRLMELKGVGKGTVEELEHWLNHGVFIKEKEFKEAIGQTIDTKAREAAEKAAAKENKDAFAFI